jgi:hypothetical protein
MGISWRSVTVSLALVLTAATSAQAQASGNLREQLVELQKRIDDGTTRDCPDIVKLRNALPKTPPRTDVYYDLYASMKARANQWIARYCGGGGPPCQAPAPPEWAVYKNLLERVMKRRSDCAMASDAAESSRLGCDDLDVLEKELVRQAVAQIRLRPETSPKAKEVLDGLGGVFGPNMSPAEVIMVLRLCLKHGDVCKLPPEKMGELIKMAFRFKDQPALFTEVINFVNELGKQTPSEDQVNHLLKATLRMAREARGDFDGVVSRALLQLTLQDPKKTDALRVLLGEIERRYKGQAGRDAKAAVDSLVSTAPSEVTVLKALDWLDPIVWDQVTLDAQAQRAVSAGEVPTIGANRILVFYGSGQQDAACTPGANYVKKFIKTLNHRYGPNSGFQPEIRLASLDEYKRLETAARGFLDTGNAEAFCPTTGEAPYPELCKRRFPGIFFLKFTPGTNGTAVGGRYWLNVGTAVGEGTIKPGVVANDCTEAAREEGQGFTDAVQAARNNPLVFQPPPVGDPPLPPARPSAWSSLVFAGAPFIADKRATVASAVIPSVLDGALLIGAGVSGELAIQYRNDANGQPGSLDPANRALVVSASLLGGLLVTRVVFGLIYGNWETAWTKKGFQP